MINVVLCLFSFSSERFYNVMVVSDIAFIFVLQCFFCMICGFVCICLSYVLVFNRLCRMHPSCCFCLCFCVYVSCSYDFYMKKMEFGFWVEVQKGDDVCVFFPEFFAGI